MKKNFSLHKGFTLVELMIVIAILGTLFAIMSQFNANPSIYQGRVTALAEKIQDTIRDARQNTIIWKTFQNNSVTERIFSISKTNNTITVTASGSQIQNPSSNQETNFSIHLDGDENYTIEKIEVATGTLSDRYDKSSTSNTWQEVDNLEITFFGNIQGKATSPSNSQIKNIRSYRITLEYKGFKRYIYGDVLMGNTDIHTQLGSVYTPTIVNNVNNITVATPTVNPVTPPHLKQVIITLTIPKHNLQQHKRHHPNQHHQ